MANRLNAARGADIHQWRVARTSPLAMAAVVLLCVWTMAWLAMQVGTDYRLTNESLQNTHWSLPLLLVLTSLLAVRATRDAPARSLRRLVAVGGLLVGSGLAIAVYLALALWLLDYALFPQATQPVHVQHLVSPDRSKVADVAYYPPATSVASMGTLTVRVTYLVGGVPMVTREVYGEPLHDIVFNMHPQPYRRFVQWRRDDALVVPSARLRIDLTPLRVQLEHA